MSKHLGQPLRRPGTGTLKKARRKILGLEEQFYAEPDVAFAEDYVSYSRERSKRRKKNNAATDLIRLFKEVGAASGRNIMQLSSSLLKDRGAALGSKLQDWQAHPYYQHLQQKKLAWTIPAAIAALALGGTIWFSAGSAIPGADGSAPKVSVVEEKADQTAVAGATSEKIACAIKVGGETLFVAQDRTTAEAIIKEVVDHFSKGQVPEGYVLEEVKIKEAIEYEETKANPSEVQSAEEIKQKLIAGKGEKVPYIVKNGDTLWSIAAKHGMSWDELRRANAQLVNENRLKIDQEIFLNRPLYYLNVASTYRAILNEDIPFPTKVVRDDNLRLGASTIQQEGVKGKREATYRIVKENDYQVELELLEEKVLQKPVEQIVARGSYYQVASRGSGSLTWPVSGQISSPYGYRGREFHTGVDIVNRLGTPIVAVADGVVISANWGGGYGKTILIDHGGGLTTRYAHLSTISVGEGENVGQGQTIGNLGNTGRTSGPHLHFETLINGNHQNPMGFLR